MRRTDEFMRVLSLGAAQSGRPAEHWTPTEAVAWIASRSWYLVSGTLPYGCHMFDMGFGLHAALCTPTWAVADDIAAAFCQCGQPHVNLSALRQWNNLTPEARAAAEEGSDTELAYLKKTALRTHCVCFRDAERLLFAAASAGTVVARGQRLGVESDVVRTAWVGATLQEAGSLTLSSEGWVDVMFKRTAILETWPETEAFRPNREMRPTTRSRGRPENTAVARGIMRDRFKAGVMNTNSVLAEAKACIEEQKRRNDWKPGDIPSVKGCANALRAEWLTLVAKTERI